ncbi:MAG: hypothetical protein KME40_10340 [Komarekiella atlantica HA4396-MV6]|nr:hypothetical protein [Komarekiella atlantica HA4396-MV6]
MSEVQQEVINHREKLVACFPTERYANPQGAAASAVGAASRGHLNFSVNTDKY